MIYPQSEVICPKCNHRMPRYTGARAQYFSCGSCRTYFSDKSHVIRIEGDFVKDMSAKIPIGSIGKFDSIDYVVVGLLIGKEVNTFYFWNEYILYNQDHGYLTLSEYSGHWNIVRPISAPKAKGSNYTYEGVKYDLFSKYDMFYAAAEGEFTWNLIPKKDNKVSEYIAPPHSILREENEGKVEWHQATYLSPDALKAAFKASLAVKTSSPVGVYSNQPNPYIEKATWVWKYTIGFIIGIALVLFLQMMITPSERVFNEALSVDTLPGKPEAYKTFVSNDFKLNSALGYSSLRITLDAPLDNTWLEAEVNLINQTTDDEYNAEVGMEYYHGYEGGENWSEGSRSQDKILSMVPDGTYKLSITPHTESTTSFGVRPTPKVALYNVAIDQNTAITSNYVMVILLILVYPIYVWIRKSTRESSRWGNSEYGG